MESGYFGAKIYFLINKNRWKMENLRYIIVSALYNATLLLFRSLRDALSNNKNVDQNQPKGKWWFVGLKVDILFKKLMLKMENRRLLILDVNNCVLDVVLNFSKPILWIFPTFVYILKRIPFLWRKILENGTIISSI